MIPWTNMKWWIHASKHYWELLTQMETGSVGWRKTSAGMVVDSLWLWEGDEDEEGQGLKAAAAAPRKWCTKWLVWFLWMESMESSQCIKMGMNLIVCVFVLDRSVLSWL